MSDLKEIIFKTKVSIWNHQNKLEKHDLIFPQINILLLYLK